MINKKEIKDYVALFESIGLTETKDQILILENLYQFGNILYNSFFNIGENKNDKEEKTNQGCCLQQIAA